MLALLQGPSVFVHLDPRKKGVVVPPNFRKQPQLLLQIGLNMAVAIPDLRVEDEGISCTLSFNRTPFWCVLPWSAIYALVSEDGPGMVWPDDVPPEVAAQMQAAVSKQQPKRPRPKLAAVGSRPASEPPEPTKEEPSAEEEAPTRGADVVQLRPLQQRKEKEAEAAAEAEPVAEDTPRPPPPRIGGKKPRRELPPYLKVIK